MVLYGSNLGDANAHSTTNMPVLLAGGGFRHAGHLAFDRSRTTRFPIFSFPCSSVWGSKRTSSPHPRARCRASK